MTPGLMNLNQCFVCCSSWVLEADAQSVQEDDNAHLSSVERGRTQTMCRQLLRNVIKAMQDRMCVRSTHTSDQRTDLAKSHEQCTG